MNRRQAIFRISVAGTVVVTTVAGVTGYKWYDINKKPDLAYLDKNKELIAALAETIIPATDSPGAREAAVQDFIILMINECTERKTQNKFINGLKDLQSYSENKYGKLYQHCDAKEQELVMAHFENKGKPFKGLAGKVQSRFLGNSFFTTLKKYTVEGYCTSQPGATKGLAYLYIPGSYHGCIPLNKGQKGWATN